MSEQRQFSPEVLVAGVDEAGRGPLAGPVTAAAVILDPENPISGLADSKKLSEKRRESLAELIRSRSIAWALGWSDAEEIDSINILQASLMAMRRAVESLNIQPLHALIDGNRCPALSCTAEAIVGGDAIVPSISAASILAKVARDQYLHKLDEIYPHYGFARHKGYPVKLHILALNEHGPCPEHRRSYAPVRKAMKLKDTP